MSRYNISICQVFYFGRKQHDDETNLLTYNLDFFIKTHTDRVNKYKFVIVNNSPFKYTKSLPPNITIEYINGISDREIVDPRLHHSKSLALGINHVKKYHKYDYLILTEPDFVLTTNINHILEYMRSNLISVIGTPYGKKGAQHDVIKYNKAAVAQVPTIHYMIADKLISGFNLDVSSQQSQYKQYDSIHEYDTSIALRQSMHRYKYLASRVCLSKDCLICKKNGLDFSSQFYELVGKVEKHYLFNGLLGLHLQRYNSKDLSLLENTINEITQQIKHPNNDYHIIY